MVSDGWGSLAVVPDLEILEYRVGQLDAGSLAVAAEEFDLYA